MAENLLRKLLHSNSDSLTVKMYNREWDLERYLTQHDRINVRVVRKKVVDTGRPTRRG